MKTFFADFKRSLSDWGWYKDISEGKHPLKLSYAVVLSLITALVLSIVLTISLYAVLIPGAREFVNNQLPADLVITMKSGILSINQPQPYRFELPQKEVKDGRVNFLVIDTEAEAVLDSPLKYETYIFANKDTIIMEKSSGEVRAYRLKDFPDGDISRDKMNGYLAIATKFAWVLSIVVFVMVAVFNFVGLVITFAVAGVLLWLVMKITSRNIRFGDAFAICMYAYTFIFILDLVFMFFHGGFGFVVSVLLTVLLGSVFLFMPDHRPSSPLINENK